MRNVARLAIGAVALAVGAWGLLRWKSAAIADLAPVTTERAEVPSVRAPNRKGLPPMRWVANSGEFGGEANDAGSPPPALAGYDDRPLLTGTTRKAIVEEIAASGPNHAVWTQQAAQVFPQIKSELPRELSEQVEIRNSECFESACVTDVVYADPAAYDGSVALFWSNAKLIGWSGVKGRTPPETLESGKLLISWLLFNPEN